MPPIAHPATSAPPEHRLPDVTATLDPGVLLTPDGLADRWSCSRAFVYKCLADGLPSLKLGRARRIRVGDADAWVAAQQSEHIARGVDAA